jgi:hypothetical protein
VPKNTTWLLRGRREGHDGLQYTPVERTAYTNAPSMRASRDITARQSRRELSADAMAIEAFIVYIAPSDDNLTRHRRPRYPILRFKLAGCSATGCTILQRLQFGNHAGCFD